MSVSSASCVAGAGEGAGAGVVGADIIDLDRYMRASVRPSRHRHHAYTRERLVVDAGGADRVPRGSVTSSSSERRTMPLSPTPRAPYAPRAQYCKRYSHDSGLSEDTYVKRKHKSNRRILEKHPESHRTAASNSSERDFRATCERALRQQQEQIARVAAICEQLVQPQMIQNQRQDAVPTRNGSMPSQLVQNVNQIRSCPSQSVNREHFDDKLPRKAKRRPATPDSSDLTSSSYSSRDVRRKDRRRTESCKTYNLIMGKLDELNHLFVARRAAPVRARTRASSGSVSVCDKKVATEDVKRNTTPIVQVMHSSRVSNRFEPDRGKPANKQLAVTRAPAVDIEPVEKQCGGDSTPDNYSGCDCAAPTAFDLDDPLHLYAQAKRLQAVHTTRHCSERHSARRSEHASDKRTDKRGDNSGSKASSSLCALCRGYWRLVGRFIKQQLFGTCP